MEEKKCDGNCNGDESPCKREPVRRVRVDGWGLFDYCLEAIAEDQRRGLKLFEETGEEILNTTTQTQPPGLVSGGAKKAT